MKTLPFMVCTVATLLGASQSALANAACEDEVVKRAMVRHFLAAERLLDSHPLDPIAVTGQLSARQTKTGEFSLGGREARRPQSWALAPSSDRTEFVIEKVGTGSLGVRVLLCGYTWPGTKSEMREKFTVENLTVATKQTTHIDHDASSGKTVSISHVPDKRTIYLVLMEPESLIRTLNYKITMK